MNENENPDPAPLNNTTPTTSPNVRHASDREKIRLGHTFQPAKGEKVINFIEKYLVLEDGRPFKLLPWMKEFIHSCYSWIKPDGTRSTKIGLLTCGRKNAKSCLSFGLCAYHLLADGEESPSVVSAAVNREQAAQIFKWFAYAITKNRKLESCLVPVESKKIIRYPKKAGVFKSLSCDAAGNFGHGHTFVLSDELAFHKRDDLYTALKNSTDAKPNGLQIITSTAGWNRNGVFYKLVDYSRKVMSGEIIDTTFQPWIYEAQTEDYDDESNWYAANPSLGVTQSLEDFRANYLRDKREITSRLSWVRLKANRWTDSEDGWIDPDQWNACKGTFPDLTGKPVTVAVDVGATRDLTAVALIAKVEDRFFVKSWGFVPESVFKTRDNVNSAAYQAFQSDGSLTVTKGTATDTDKLKAFLDELCIKYKVQSVVFDKWQSLELSNHLERKRVQTFNFPQTHSYFNAPCQELEKLVGNRRLVHDGNGLLAWQIGHTYLNRDSKGYVKPTTSRPENKKDNLIALLMALSQTLVNEPKWTRSVYEDRGFWL